MQRYEVPRAQPTSYKAIAKLADDVLFKFAPEVLQGRGHFDVLNYLEFRLVQVHETDYCVSESLPPGTWAETRLKMVTLSSETYINAHNGQAFARFTVAHEIGHVVLHQKLLMKRFWSSQSGRPELALYRREELEPFRDPEWQANEFAAALLMPLSGISLLRQRHSERYALVNRIMEVFKVSFTAANYRVEKLIRRGKLKV